MENPKEILKTWKLYMSSLFARSAPYLVTGFESGDWLFTDIKPENIQKNTVETDSVLNFVTFRKKEIQDMICEAFPLFKEASVIVNLKSINNAIGKFGIDKLKLVLENKQVVRLVVAGKDDHVQLQDCECIGKLLSMYELNYYIGYIDRFISRKSLDSSFVVISSIDKDQLKEAKGSVNYIRMRTVNPGTKKWHWFRLPLIDGRNFPSFYEYGKKSGFESYILNAELLWRQRSVEVVIAYTDDSITVRSCCPRRLWYPVLEK